MGGNRHNSCLWVQYCTVLSHRSFTTIFGTLPSCYFWYLEDREYLDACLSDAFDPDDKDTLEFLPTFKCFRMPRKDNIQNIILELAHQEMIQKPRYVVNSWAPIVITISEP